MFRVNIKDHSNANDICQFLLIQVFWLNGKSHKEEASKQQIRN